MQLGISRRRNVRKLPTIARWSSTYISDPMRVKIASEAAEATHAGTKKVQRMVREIILSDKPSAGWRSKKPASHPHRKRTVRKAL